MTGSALLDRYWPPGMCSLLGLTMAISLGWSPTTLALGLLFAGLMYFGVFRKLGPLSEPAAILSVAIVIACCWMYGPLDHARFVFFIYIAPAPYAYAGRPLSGRIATAIGLSVAVQIAMRDQPALEVFGHVATLLTAAVAWIISGETTSKIWKERERYKDASLTDSLTGLWTLNQTIALSQKALEDRPEMAVMFIDMDGFKQFNDAFGHLAGNRVLREFAAVLKERAREISPESIVGRMGGDEFVVVLPAISGVAAHEAREHLGQTTAAKVFKPDPEFNPIGLRFSIGLATSSVSNPVSIEMLVHLADIDMYREKYCRPTPDELPMMGEPDLPGEYRRYLRHLAETDIYTYGHSQHASNTAVELALELGLPDSDVEAIGVAGWLHDVGKVLIPISILRKPTGLQPEEYDTVKDHVMDTLNLIEHLGLPPKVTAAILSHHERWDGQGYPLRTMGNQVPIEGRILQIADAFSAMTLKRVYRHRATAAEAVAEILKNAGSQFDPHLAKVFAEMWERKGRLTRARDEGVEHAGSDLHARTLDGAGVPEYALLLESGRRQQGL